MTQKNIVLIVMDTARADETALGRDETPMPWLTEFATGGTTFSNARSNAPWTLPSHGTLFSGQYPSVHGTHAAHKSFDYDPSLAHLLAEGGYQTVAISNNTWISSEFGFDRGFDDFLTTWQLFQDEVDFGGVARRRTGPVDKLRGILGEFRGNPLKNLSNLVYGQFFRKRYDDGARRTNRLIDDRLDSWIDDEPLFLFVNYLEPHLEYHPPEQFAQQYLPAGVTLEEAEKVNQDAWAFITGDVSMSDREFEILRGLYRAELAYLDTRLEELFGLFDERGVLDETVFIVTGDHGENVGDHGLMDHQYSLHETLLRTPLVIRGDGFSEETVTAPVQGIDLMPTILDIADANIPDDLPGRSLKSPHSLQLDRPVFAEYVAPQPPIETLRERYDCRRNVDVFDRRLWAIIRADAKYVRGSDGAEWYFDLDGDPEELGEDSDRSIEKNDLRTELESWTEDLPSVKSGSVSMTDETKNRLEDLGYLQ